MTRHDWFVVTLTVGPLLVGAAYVGVLKLERTLLDAYRREGRERPTQEDLPALSGGVLPEA